MATQALALGRDGVLVASDGSSGGGQPAGGQEQGSITFHQPADPASPNGSVLFRTEPLPRATAMFGRPTLTLRASLSGPDANFYVELLDIAPNGTETLVNNGFLRASHRESHVTPTPVPVGEVTTFTIDIRADHHRFAAGHRIAVRISGGAADTLTPNPTPVDVTIATAGSVLRIPAAPVN